MSLCGAEQILTWTIENYSFVEEGEGKRILCPCRWKAANTGDPWGIVLFPNTMNENAEECVSLKLEWFARFSHEQNLKIKFFINVELLNTDSQFISLLEVEKECNLEDCMVYEFSNVLKTAELQKIMKKSATDTLIVRCRIRRADNGSPDIKTCNSTAKTRIVVNKYSLTDNVCFKNNIVVLMKRIILGPDTFDILVKAPEDDVLIEIRRKNEEHDCKVKCHVFLLDCEKTEILSCWDFFTFKKREITTWHFPTFIKKSFLVYRELSSRCTLRFDFLISYFEEIREYIEEAEGASRCSSLKASEKPVSVSLQDDLNAMLLNDKYADVKLRVGKEIISAHKLFLDTRSPVFSAMFDHRDMIENQTGEIEITDIDADTMKRFLKFLYTGMLDKLDSEKALALLLAAEKYQVPSLKLKCSDHLVMHLDADNICDVVSVADMVGQEILKTAAINYIKENASKILGSPSWTKWIKKNRELGSEILCKLSEHIKRAS